MTSPVSKRPYSLEVTDPSSKKLAIDETLEALASETRNLSSSIATLNGTVQKLSQRITVLECRRSLLVPSPILPPVSPAPRPKLLDAIDEVLKVSHSYVNYQKEEECIKKALENPMSKQRQSSLHCKLGELALRQRKYQVAEGCYNKALDCIPRSSHILCLLGNLSRAQGKNEEAKNYYKKAHECDPKNSAVLCFLGDFVRVQGKTQEAWELYKKALKCNPRCRHAQDSLRELAST